jgi:scyllo-inositol 2-dehydrogenase (NADP+)
VAVIGYGLAGSVFHAPLVAATPGLELRAIVTAHPERRARAASSFPGVRLPATPDELWSDLSGIDLVVVATPNHLHATQAIAALESGRAVVVDKPMALSTVEAERMLAAGERSRRPLAVFHNRRWDSDFLLLRELVSGGELGALLRMESRFERFRPEPAQGTWRVEMSSQAGGGRLLDLGSHLIDQALLLCGQPEGVYAEISQVRPASGSDDDSFLALSFPGGARAHLWMSDLAPSVGPRWRAWGSRAALEVWGLDPQEDHLRAGRRPGDPGFGEPDGSQRALLTVGREAGGSAEAAPLPAGRWGDFYAGMASAIRGEAPVPVDPGAGWDVLAVIEAARRSAETGAVTRPRRRC